MPCPPHRHRDRELPGKTVAAYKWRVLCVVSGGTAYAHEGRGPGGKGRVQSVGEVWVRYGWGVDEVCVGCGCDVCGV